MKPVFTLLLLFPAFSAFDQTTDSVNINQSQEENYEWRTLEEDLYSIEYPLDWIADNSGQLGAKLFLFSPENSKDDQFIESINLVIADLPTENTSLKEYSHRTEDELASMITNFKLLENEQLNNQNGDFQRVVYTGDHNKYKLQFIKHYWIVKGKVYVLTFTGEKSNFESYLEVANKTLNSFTIKE